MSLKHGDIIKGLTEMADESIKIRPSIKVLVSGLISQRDQMQMRRLCIQITRKPSAPPEAALLLIMHVSKLNT